ncbi:hypothetical protein GCM10027299_57470 [Larkinella ripae]
MNLDELKSTWQAYDEKILASQHLSERLVFLMLKDRSKSTLARMQRNLRFAGSIMTGVILFFSAAIVGNAFDYTRWYFYIPSVLYISLALAALIVVGQNYHSLSRVSLSRQNLHESLTTVLQRHEKAQAALTKIWILCLLAGFLFTVSMIARKFEAYSVLKISVVLGAQVVLILLLFSIAHWIFRAFDDKLGQELKENLRELDHLNTAS